MSNQPGTDPIQNLQTLGEPGIGQATSGLQVASKWQMGIAVPLKNRKFEYGKVVSLKVNNDPFDRNKVEKNETQLGITHNDQSIKTLPSNLIQYGDRAIIGPSSDMEHYNRKESVRVAASYEESSPDDWTKGVIIILDRLNKYEYNSLDEISIFGSGLASAWEIKNNHLLSVGIKKGFRSLNRFGLYDPLSADITLHDNTISSNHLTLAIRLPVHPSANLTDASGPGGGPSIFFSSYGLTPWRYLGALDQNNNWDWRLANEAKGFLRFIDSHANNNLCLISYNSDIDSSTLNFTGKTVKASIITGFWHPGGQIKDTAQAIFCMVGPHSITSGSNKISTGIITQYITESIEDNKDLSYSPLVSNTYYRMGLTWRGSLKPSGANSAGSELWAKFQWGSIAKAGSMISTPTLLNSNNATQDNWAHSQVSGLVESINTDYLDPENNIKVEVVLKASSPSAYTTNRSGRGAEALVFLDNLWVEHQGDIPGASNRGYVEIDHYPEMGTLTINEQDSEMPINLKMSDGSTRLIDPTGNMYKKLFVIEADFLRVSQPVYEQFRRLLEWQKRGFKLTLHPFLPEVPHCLVGVMEIERVSKNFWDLTRFNFRFRFTETD